MGDDQDSTDSKDRPGLLARVKDGASARWQQLRRRHFWLRHVLAAWRLLGRNNGNQYAGAITYFSFLALFPLLLLAVAVTGFVLHAHPSVQQSLFAHVTAKVPGGFGDTLKTAIHTAIKARTGVGIVGLIGVLLTGLGWIGNLRAAVNGVWGRRRAKQNFIVAKLANLVVLAGLGVGILVSLALTALGTSLTEQLLSFVGLADVPGSTVLLKIIGIGIAVVGDMLIFWWLLVRLPQAALRTRTALLGALMASVGFEVLKILGTYTIAHTAHSPTAGPFAGIIAVLVWIQLVARWMLFCCAWMATAREAPAPANQLPIVEPAVMSGQRLGTGRSAITPTAVGVTLLGAGAVVGAVATIAASTSARRGAAPSRE